MAINNKFENLKKTVGGIRTDADPTTADGDLIAVRIDQFGQLMTVAGAGALSPYHEEDTAHTTADYGVQCLAVRNDTLATLVSHDGDYSPLQVDSSGALFVNIGAESVNVDVNMEGVDPQGIAVSGNPMQVAHESANFDGAALPNAVAGEGLIIRPKASMSGVQYGMLVNEDGSASPIVAEGTAAGVGLQIVLDDGTDGAFAQSDATGHLKVVGSIAHDASSTTSDPFVMAYEATDVDGAPLPNTVSHQGDVIRAKGTLSGIGLQMLVTEDGSFSPVEVEGTAAGAGVQIVLDDGTDSVYAQGDTTGRLRVVGPAAEDAAVAGDPVLGGGRYDAAARSLDDGDAGAIALDAAGRQILVGSADSDAPRLGAPVMVGGQYKTTPGNLDNNDAGILLVDVQGRALVSGAAAENAAVVGSPVLTGGRYDATPRDLDDGDAGAIALDADANQIFVGPAAHDAAALGNPLLVGAEANAADRADVDEDDVAQFSADLAGYVRARLKGYDAAADASKVAPTVTDADRYLDSEELVDGTSIDADPALYYPSTAGLEMGEFDHLTVQFVLANGSVVTIEATLDDDGTPDWIDITPSGYLLNADSTGNASFTDVSGIVDFDGLNVQKVRVKLDGDGDSDAQIHIKRRRR